MARYLESKCKMSRRVSLDLNLKALGGRNINTKCKLKTLPGQHGAKKKKNKTNYSIQLKAKQAIKYNYGVLEKQFFNVYKKTLKFKGARGEVLLKLLERRLDNVVYRMGFAVTRAEARQLVSHKNVIVLRKNIEKIISIPSFNVKKNDIIKIKNKNNSKISHALMCTEKIGFSPWVNVNTKEITGTFLRDPERNELTNEFNEQLVVEFYSK